MPMFCVVYGCSNRSNREKDKSFYRIPKIVIHKGEKCKKLTEQRRKKWFLNLRLRSAGAEYSNARVCSDHFVTGCPGALGDVESVDWAPTVNLGYQYTKPISEVSLQREQRTKLKEDQQRRSDCAETMLDLQKPAESSEPEQQRNETLNERGYAAAGCQTELMMDDIEKMEGVLRQIATELRDFRTRTLDTRFN
ncbi:uncharacterized protein LOC114461801 isoform X2 [Gouania willdenowi]|uniref:uncharacterized protein LOC114461801 isoform X2 n=1 Tax=Gouania willdenowi TaxID=441366 RepID=UPI0010565C0B|nr:uncharacterized protein LOC114461801 isoform X2 [Gouania willdenowi]